MVYYGVVLIRGDARPGHSPFKCTEPRGLQRAASQPSGNSFDPHRLQPVTRWPVDVVGVNEADNVVYAATATSGDIDAGRRGQAHGRSVLPGTAASSVPRAPSQRQTSWSVG